MNNETKNICLEDLLKELLELSAKIATPERTEQDLIRRMEIIKFLFHV